MEKTEKILTIIAVLGLILIAGILLSNHYGLKPNLDWSSSETVATNFVRQLGKMGESGFFNRQDKLAYAYFTPEGEDLANNHSGSLIEKIFAFSGTKEAPNSFEVIRVVEQGNKAEVDMAWHYASPHPDQTKTVFLTRQAEDWGIYSIVNTYGRR